MQRLPHRHVAREGAVEIMRRVIVETGRGVADQAAGMRQEPVERHAVDEGLQGRARRADRPRHVDGAGPPGIVVVGTADPGQDGTAAPIRHQGGQRQGTRQLVQRLG